MIRVEHLRAARGHTSIYPPAVHMRVWLGESPDDDITSIVRQLAHSQPLYVELFDVRPSSEERLRAAGLVPTTMAGRPVLPDIADDRLRDVIRILAADSFGAWVGVDASKLPDLLLFESNQERAAGLPERAMYLIFSLYDDNFEIFAAGISTDEIEASIRQASQGVRSDS